jgi:Zn-dependent protease
LLFVLFAVLLLVLANTEAAALDITWPSTLAVLVLLLSVAVHEFAHVIVAKWLGGRIQEVVLGPFGGLVRPSLPDFPKTHLLVALAGPLANLACGVLAAAAVLLAYRHELGDGLVNPFVPIAASDNSLTILLLGLAVWLNWLLALANFLPVFPFDGAVVYRSALRYRLGRATAAVYVSRGGYVCALALLGLAWWLRDAGSTSAVPMWFPLLLAAVFVGFSAHRDSRKLSHKQSRGEIREDSGHDFGSDQIVFEEDVLEARFSSAEDWRAEPIPGVEPWRAADDETEEARLDDVLAKLHHCGFDGLSTEDRQFLERASQRYRSRRQNRSTEDA